MPKNKSMSEPDERPLVDHTPNQLQANPAVANAVTSLLYFTISYVIPLACIGIIVWLAVDAFSDSVEAGVRSFCAALLPLIIVTYVREMQSKWLDSLRLPTRAQYGLGAGAALAAIVALAVLRSQPESTVTAQLALGFALSFVWLGLPAPKQHIDGPAEAVVVMSFIIAFGLSVYVLFTFDG